VETRKHGLWVPGALAGRDCGATGFVPVAASGPELALPVEDAGHDMEPADGLHRVVAVGVVHRPAGELAGGPAR
jgi:hypothetical protein